jgi:tryptophan-rich sensory protein
MEFKPLSSRSVVLICVLVPVAVSILVNAFIYEQGYTKRSADRAESALPLPPGYVIGIIWVLLFGLLGYAYARLLVDDAAATVARWAIIVTVAYCLAYPFLTRGFDPQISRAFNKGALVFAIGTSLAVWHATKRLHQTRAAALYCTLPLLAWVAYVNLVDLNKQTNMVTLKDKSY